MSGTTFVVLLSDDYAHMLDTSKSNMSFAEFLLTMPQDDSETSEPFEAQRNLQLRDVDF